VAGARELAGWTRQIKSLSMIGMVPFWLPLAAIHADAGRTIQVQQPA
jgi:hypothetical protein